MTQEIKVPNSSEQSPSLSLCKRLVTWACYGALAGFVCSSPGVDWTFDNLNPFVWFGGILAGVVLFGIPAGLILGWLDSRRGNRRGWHAIIKVLTLMVGGALLLFGIFAIPTTIDVLARSGSSWLAGASGNGVLRQAIGAVAGACFGLIIPPSFMMSKQLSNWAYAKLPSAPEERANI